jgi:hypothetical protein
MTRSRLASAALAAALAAAALAAAAPASAQDPRPLQGLFCNTEAQIDRALADIAAGLSPGRAADRANREAVVCTHVDRRHFMIAAPVVLGDDAVPLVKHRGALVGVLVGGNLRPVTPAADLYFLTPGELPGAVVERRT